MEELGAKERGWIWSGGSLGSKTIGVARSHTTNVPIYARQKLYTLLMNER